jgi:hypothetical protein
VLSKRRNSLGRILTSNNNSAQSGGINSELREAKSYWTLWFDECIESDVRATKAETALAKAQLVAVASLPAVRRRRRRSPPARC